MKRTVTVTIERIRRVTTTIKRREHEQEIFIALTLTALLAAAAHPQGPPFAAGLQTPTRIVFSPQGNLIVAESGTTAKNSGRVSIIDRTSGARRTLVDGLPSGVSGAGAEAAPSGPSGVAVHGAMTIYVTIGAGDGVLPGTAPGTEIENPSPASPIVSSLLSLRSSAPLDLATGGFTLLPGDHARLKSGETITLTNANEQTLTVKLVADFPNFTPSPRPDAPTNVRAGNPFGVAVLGDTVFVVDASQNLIRRVNATTGTFETLTTFAPFANPLPFGPPFVDAVPDSITLRGSDLLVTTLTGFPFPQGRAEVRKVNTLTGTNEPYISGVTSGIDVQPLGGDTVAVLEFSTNMTASEPGRLRMLTPGGQSTVLASSLSTPTSIAVDQRSGEIFVAHIFPGLITRVNATGKIPAAPPTAIIPVVASLPGALGSQYATSMQMSNPHPFAILGRLVIHPMGASGSATDPTLLYKLDAFQTVSYPDFMKTAQVSGGGSVDVIAAVGSAPVTVTTIANVAAEGMPLIQVPQVHPDDALTAGTRGTLVAPAEPAHTRFNIGVRTLADGASMTFHVHDANGTEVRSTTRALPPNYFQQFAAGDLLGGTPAANQSVAVTIESGSAIAYGVAIDNATGDATLQIARRTAE